MSEDKIKIAVSSCLLGEAVRYDGTDKHIDYLTTELAAEYNLISICPEMAIGMGVPRPPIHLVKKRGGVEARGVADDRVNMTQKLVSFAHEVTQTHFDFCGYIFKKRSPSCGTKDVKVMNASGVYEETGQGIYANVIMSVLPQLPVIDEEEFQDQKFRDIFFLAVETYAKKISRQL